LREREGPAKREGEGLYRKISKSLSPTLSRERERGSVS
jgi:hypothetical protein